MTEIWFIRHGETDWNRQRRLQGWQAFPLNGRPAAGRACAGRAHARAVQTRFDALYSSDLQRARDTAQPVAELDLRIRTEPASANAACWKGWIWNISTRWPRRRRLLEEPRSAAPAGRRRNAGASSSPADLRIRTEPGIRERGVLEGLDLEHIDTLAPAAAPPGRAAIRCARWTAAKRWASSSPVISTVDDIAARHGGERIMLFTHGGVLDIVSAPRQRRATRRC